MNIPKWIMKPVSIIPKGQYCYEHLEHIKGTLRLKVIGTCPYWWCNPKADDQSFGYCQYIEVGDWEEGGTLLLFDMVKECGVGDDWEDYAEGDAELIR